MSVKVEISAETFDRIDSQLSKLPILNRRPVLKSGMKAAGDVIVKYVKEIIPQPGYPGDKPGLKPLRDTVRTNVKDYAESGVVVAVVGYQYPAGAHGHLIEEGVKPHTIKAKNAKVLADTGRAIFGKEINHPGAPGYHYLQKAADATKDAQNAAIESSVAAAIAEATSGV